MSSSEFTDISDEAIDQLSREDIRSMVQVLHHTITSSRKEIEMTPRRAPIPCTTAMFAAIFLFEAYRAMIGLIHLTSDSESSSGTAAKNMVFIATQILFLPYLIYMIRHLRAKKSSFGVLDNGTMLLIIALMASFALGITNGSSLGILETVTYLVHMLVYLVYFRAILTNLRFTPALTLVMKGFFFVGIVQRILVGLISLEDALEENAEMFLVFIFFITQFQMELYFTLSRHDRTDLMTHFDYQMDQGHLTKD